MSQVLLDPEGMSETPEGHKVVTSEVAFWRSALQDTPLHLKGVHLCEWAKVFYEGRNQTIREAWSPSQELRKLCSTLTLQQAKQLREQLGSSLDALPRPLTLTEVARAHFSGDWWCDPPSAEHAARWLTWWWENDPDESSRVLLRALSSYYGERYESAEARAYAVQSKPQAVDLLSGWLGLSSDAKDFGSFPTELPKTVRGELRQDFKGRALTSKGQFFSELLRDRADVQVLRLAADVSAEYLLRHPDELTLTLFRTLERYLSLSVRASLADLLPVAAPGLIPHEGTRLKDWYLDGYLPYRLWQRHNEKLIKQVGREFAEIYLQLYAEALSGSAEYEHLSWSKARHLRQSGRVTLLVILDGLGYTDMRVFWDELERLDVNDRLSLGQTDVAFAPLPSITECAKPSLVKGVSPLQAADADLLAPVQKKDADVESALSKAQPGDLVIWSLLEPDHTYHSHKDVNAAKDMAHAVLGGLAKRILKQMVSVPADLNVRLVVTTDHGRLLTESKREIASPPKFWPHGRAALGTFEHDFPERGYEVKGDIMYLSGTRFSLDRDAAIVLTEASFLTQDGRQGVDAYPHGGLFPEEVLIPWWTVERDATLSPLVCSVHGKGVSGRDAMLVIKVDNPNAVSVKVEELLLNWLSEMPRVDETVNPMSSLAHSLMVRWPSVREAESATARLRYSLPNGTPLEAVAEVRLESEEMYTRDNPLEDLL